MVGCAPAAGGAHEAARVHHAARRRGDVAARGARAAERQRVAKMYGQQKRNIIHMSSTAYEQDHSPAAHNPRARRPGGGSCSNLMDCRPTQSRMVGDHYEVKVDGAWTPVPYDTINNVVAPDGGAHVCTPRQVGPNKGVIFCVILPSKG